MSQNIPDLVQNLIDQTPNSQLFQTHISFVVVGSEKSYKVKKPMNFGFLNFETPGLRREFCLEEFRLNSKMAASLYNKVWAVDRENKLHDDLEQASNTDYVLEMNSFDQKELFTNLHKEGLLTDSHFEELALTLADFHYTKANCDEEILSYGSFENVKKIVNDNLELSNLFIGKSISQEQYNELEELSLKKIDLLKPVIDQRLKEKKVKECHGDLHLGNICVYQGKVTPFDCIEFNKEFRFIDTIYDVAFLYMDLVFNGSHHFATTFLNAYLEQTNDFEAMKLFPMYCSMRAIIRAKVTSLLLNDDSIPKEVKDEAQKTAQEYYKLGLDFLKKKEDESF